MLTLSDFFGLAIDEDRSDVNHLMEIVDITKKIETTNVVKTLTKQNGKNAAIVNVARRQQILKMIRPLINENMLDYDPNYYIKEVNTSSEHDRRYGAEEHLLEFALIVASTKSKKILLGEPKFITSKLLREAAFLESRFDRCWEILSQESQHVVSAYRKSK
ncbi:hypothetical protein [Aliikangiella maris]|uniref:Uncharacterized protein n=2 Tax=Aliikangiella maris TaxID=3162458 RepID=A0ABV2BNH7_9GAMM